MEKEKAGYLGCDVSKGYCDFLLLDGSEKVLEQTFTLTDDKAGRSTLKLLIENILETKVTTLYCGLESTGGYENNWYRLLSSLSKQGAVHVARLNPKAVKAVSDALLRRTITDAVSAENIALYMIHYSKKMVYNTNQSKVGNSEFKEGRQQLNYIHMLIKQKVQLSNQLEKLLYQHFSELITYCRNGIPGWVLNLIIKYPCAHSILIAGEKNITKVYGISKEKAEVLLRKAMASDQIVSKQTQHVISVTAKEISHKESLIKAEKEYLEELYQTNNKVKLIASTPGIGLSSAIILLLQIEYVKRFETSKKMASYFGVNPTFKQSGDGIWGNHMSKKGRGEIRSTLYMTALTAVRCNPTLKALYGKHRAHGFNHYQAIGVVMHKLLKIIYGILKNETPFDAKIDEFNVLRSTTKQKQIDEFSKIKISVQNKNQMRFMTYSEDAPISRIKHQKNKKASSVPIQKNLELAGLPDA